MKRETPISDMIDAFIKRHGKIETWSDLRRLHFLSELSHMAARMDMSDGRYFEWL